MTFTFPSWALFYTVTPSDAPPADYVNRWLPVAAAQYTGFRELWQKDVKFDGVPATELRYLFRGPDGGQYEDIAMIAPISGLAVMAVIRFRMPKSHDQFLESTETLMASENLEQITFADWFRRRAVADRDMSAGAQIAAVTAENIGNYR